MFLRPARGRYRLLPLVLLGVSLAHAQVFYVWKGANGDWGAAANWTPAGVPGAADTATITAGTVTLSSDRAVGVLHLAGGSLYSPVLNVLSVQVGGDWTGGVLDGVVLELVTGSEAELGSTAAKLLMRGTVRNLGRLRWTGGALNLQNGAVFDNRAEGLLEVGFDGTLTQVGAGGTTFQNAGVYHKMGGAGTNTISDLAFVNSGTVKASSGVIRFAGSGSPVQATAALNTFEADATAAIVFNRSATFGSSTFKGSGPKTIALGAQQVTLNGVIRGENLTFASGEMLGTFRLEGAMDWVGGSLQATATISSASVLRLSGAAPKTLWAASLRNSGQIVWLAGPWNVENSSTIQNLPGGVIEVQADSPLAQNGGGTSTLKNAGAYLKTGGAGTNTITIGAVENTGRIHAGSGTIELAKAVGSFSSTGPDNVVGAGETARVLIGRPVTLTGTRLEGPGVKRLDTGTGAASLNGLVKATNLVIASGQIQMAATTEGLVEWTGGTLGGRWTNPPASTVVLAGTAPKQLFVGTLLNQGTVEWREGPWNLENNSAFQNLAGGLFDIRLDGSLAQAGAGTSVFLNQGTCRKSAGPGVATLAVASIQLPGTLEILSGVVRVVGNATFGSGSVLKTRVAGPDAGSGFGQLQVTGQAALNGLIQIAAGPGLVPVEGQRFDIVTSASRTGTFTQVTGGDVGGGLYLTPVYGTKGVQLVMVDAKASFTGYSRNNGRLQIDFTGVAGSSYRIDATTNLVDWTILSTNGIPGSGVASFIDPDSATIPYRFYRAVFLP